MEKKFKKTFIHELGHYFLNKYFNYEVTHFVIEEKVYNFLNHDFEGFVKSNNTEEPQNIEKRIKNIIISSYGCVFQALYTKEDLKNCFDNASKDLDLIRKDLFYEINDYTIKKDRFEKFEKILRNHLIDLSKLNNNQKLDQIEIEKFGFKKNMIEKTKKKKSTEEIDNETANHFENYFKNITLKNDYIQQEKVKNVQNEYYYENLNLKSEDLYRIDDVFDYIEFKNLIFKEIDTLYQNIYEILA